MSLTYKDSGVDKEAGYREVQLIKSFIKKTHIPGVLSELGGFSGLFQLDMTGMSEPVLVSGTDGVGTKLKLAFLTDRHDTIGEDCVAMCANDILCQGAKPLFFLDYIATGKLVPEKMASIVEGVANGCVKAGCALIGGETAEMPGFYNDGEYDVAGFVVGVVDKSKIITGEGIEEGDLIIGLPSSGLHSNGFSLVRKLVLEKLGLSLDQFYPELGKTLGEELLTPTRIYRDPVYEIIEKFQVKGMSHITGGGFYENIPRMLPEGLRAKIDIGTINTPSIFKLIQSWGNIDEEEMYGTFNMGVGMVLAASPSEADGIMEFLKGKGEEFYVLGEVIKGEKGVELWRKNE
ncbi:phosphoribosylformylglycinamidine cyclo-ligase [Gudongella oleilytica]|jgi:phosphoribosylformylglycinamidine cyclo-ligase|uniref:phosphoribosylformylglycinamidine cyclo-ligase n=1 Tax=Gudongella oleilytica TaxID=1582259 RepID=UPI002A36E8D2|nr:phosphoribosylformylglycinamidine cyclo-ligase [Gudongella oleilytica]MDY0256739.1 phosphoribosylformylglycinamidine cyclo-ligase [Gudongella oleilytica]